MSDAEVLPHRGWRNSYHRAWERKRKQLIDVYRAEHGAVANVPYDRLDFEARRHAETTVLDALNRKANAKKLYRDHDPNAYKAGLDF